MNHTLVNGFVKAVSLTETLLWGSISLLMGYKFNREGRATCTFPKILNFRKVLILTY